MKYAVGERLRRLRRARNWTQQQLAQEAGLNIATISRVEHGKAAHLYADTLGDLAMALQVSADDLLGITPCAAPGHRARELDTAAGPA